MPALANPTEIMTSAQVVLRVPTDTPITLPVSQQWSVFLVHTGYDSAGEEDLNIVFVGVNNANVGAGPGNGVVVLVPGCPVMIARGEAMTLSFLASGGAPLVNVAPHEGY